MASLNNRKKIIAFVSIILGIITLIGLTYYLLSWNSNYSVQPSKVSSQLIDKIREGQKTGKAVEIDSDELNEIISMYYKNEKTVKGITVKAVHGEVINNNIKFYIPITYKAFNFLVTSEGKVEYKNEKIVYGCSYIKIGKITMPKSFVLNKIKNSVGQLLTVDDNNILIDKKIVPLQIKSLEVKNDKIIVTMENILNTLETKLKSIEDKVKENIAGNQNNKLKNIADENSSTAGKGSSTVSQGDTASSTQDTKNVSEANAALGRITSGLNSAAASVSSPAQQAVIAEMIGAANSMKGNPNANPYDYAGNVRAEYNKLSLEEKAELKSVVFSNINGVDINIVSKMLSK